jgi:mRNA interferase RelE/StbE
VAESEGKPDCYVVKITSAAHRDLQALTKKITKAQRKRIGRKINGLAVQPRPVGSEKLTENEYRLRDGDYRILYEINDKNHVVRIGRIRDRSDVYRKRP